MITKKFYNFLENIDKRINLKQLREFNSKKIISLDYEFLDKGSPIDGDLEERYTLKDFIKDDKPFIYVQKKSVENTNSSEITNSGNTQNKVSFMDSNNTLNSNNE